MVVTKWNVCSTGRKACGVFAFSILGNKQKKDIDLYIESYIENKESKSNEEINLNKDKKNVDEYIELITY